MSEPIPPTDPRPPPHAGAPRPSLLPVFPASGTEASAGGGASATGLTPNIAAGLACLVPLLSGIIFLLLEKRDPFVRLWAMQSAVFGAALIVANLAFRLVAMVFSHIPLLNLLVGILLFLLSLAVSLGGLVVWIIMLVKAFGGETWEVPVLGKIAREQLARLNF